MHKYNCLCIRDHKNRWSLVCASENDNHCSCVFFIIISCIYIDEYKSVCACVWDRETQIENEIKCVCDMDSVQFHDS